MEGVKRRVYYGGTLRYVHVVPRNNDSHLDNHIARFRLHDSEWKLRLYSKPYYDSNEISWKTQFSFDRVNAIRTRKCVLFIHTGARHLKYYFKLDTWANV